MMTPEVRDLYDNIMAKFFADNNSLMALAQQFDIDLSARKTLDDLAKDIGGEQYTTNDKSKNPLFEQNFVRRLTPGTKEHTNFMKGILDVFGAVKKVGGNVPRDLQAAVQAMQGGIETFREYVMQDAPTNHQLIWDLAQRSRQENIGKFNDWAQKAGKNFGWKYRTWNEQCHWNGHCRSCCQFATEYYRGLQNGRNKSCFICNKGFLFCKSRQSFIKIKIQGCTA